VENHYFGTGSQKHKETLDKRAQDFLSWALYRSPIDFSIIEGWRGEELQNLYFRTGDSQKRWPDGEHNHTDENGKPASLAFHLLPSPTRLPDPEYNIWKDRERLTYLAAIIVTLGAVYAKTEEGKKAGVLGVRWGGDWDRDGILNRWDKSNFDDLAHYELVVGKVV